MLTEICPKCGGPTSWTEVDIGVGTMHSPAWCNNCGWTQESDIRQLMEELGLDVNEDDYMVP